MSGIGGDSGEVVLYQREDGTPSIQVRMEGGTVWLTQAQMAELFQTTPQNITLHLKSIFAEGELFEAATCKEYLQVRREAEYARLRANLADQPSEVEAVFRETLKKAQKKIEGKKK